MAKLCQLACVNAAHEREHPLPCDAQDDAAQPHREAPDIISGSLLPRMYPTAEHLSRAVRAAESIHRLVSGPAVPRSAACSSVQRFRPEPGRTSCFASTSSGLQDCARGSSVESASF